MKYRVGNKVKIVSIEKNSDVPEGSEDMLIGAVGEIIGIDSTYHYPYRLTFENEDIESLDCVYWVEEELELIENKIQLAVDGIIKHIKSGMYESWDEIVDDLEQLKKLS